MAAQKQSSSAWPHSAKRNGSSVSTTFGMRNLSVSAVARSLCVNGG